MIFDLQIDFHIILDSELNYFYDTE